MTQGSMQGTVNASTKRDYAKPEQGRHNGISLAEHQAEPGFAEFRSSQDTRRGSGSNNWRPMNTSRKLRSKLSRDHNGLKTSPDRFDEANSAATRENYHKPNDCW